MHDTHKSILLLSMPFAGIDIPSIQLALLESYLKNNNVNIHTAYLYLKAAEFYGIRNYNYLIYPPNDSYTAQMAFSKYLFQDHWEKKIDDFRNYFDKQKSMNSENSNVLSFDEYIEKTDHFYNWTVNSIPWKNYDIIGFTLNYGQFLPSLTIAKRIKQDYPDKKIILGGSRTIQNLGKRVLESFNFIDYVVSGDGEEPLYQISTEENIQNIQGLIYRKNSEIKYNVPQDFIDLNSLPTPDFDSFYHQLQQMHPEIQQFYSYNGRIPVEISRGCWWNKCTFCNLNVQHKKYREKNVDKIVEEIEFLSNKYKTLSFQIIGNAQLVKEQKSLCEKIIELKKDFTFYAETRADHLKKEDYELFKKAGFKHIQTGIESFSNNYLKKMNKGARVIDNIAALKFSKENQIKNHYNLIFNYPNEESIDFEETKKTIELFKQYLDPPQKCQLRVLYGSPIQLNPKDYNIKHFKYSNIDRLMFPIDILQKGINFIYEYELIEPKEQNNWEHLISDWKNEQENRQLQYIKKHSEIDKNIFYYLDGKNFIKIIDKRNSERINIFNLDEVERKIFLDCSDIINIDQLKQQNLDLTEEQIMDILENFEEAGLIFREYDSYLSLPLNINNYKKITQKHVEKSRIIQEI